MSRVQISPEESARYFLHSRQWASLMETDITVQPSAAHRVLLLFVAPWADAGRASRAVGLLDKELRRAATAWSLWREADRRSDQDVLTEARGQSAEADDEPRPLREYRDHLETFCAPTPSKGGHLRITAVQADPFAVLLMPEGPATDVLTAQPASTLAYAMSAFGQQMHVRHHWHSRLDAARYASPAETLRVLLTVLNGEWPGAAPGQSTVDDDVPGRPGLYRAISPASHTSPGHRRRAGAVVYVAAPGEQDILVAVGLHDQATSVWEYRHVGRTSDVAP